MAHDAKNIYDYENLPNYPLINLRKHEELREAEYAKLSPEDRALREIWDDTHKRLQLDAYQPIKWIDFRSYAHLDRWLDYLMTGVIFGGAISVVVYWMPYLYRMRKAKRGDTGGLHIRILQDSKRRTVNKSLRMMYNFGSFQLIFEIFGGLMKDYGLPRFWTSIVGGAFAGGLMSIRRNRMGPSFGRGAAIGAVFIGLIEVVLGSPLNHAPYIKPFEKVVKVEPHPSVVRVPPVPYAEIDSEFKETIDIWNKNSRLNGFTDREEYIHDNRLWSWPDLNIIGTDVGERYGIPTNEKATYNMINTSKAYEIGQLDWHSANESTGRFTNVLKAKDMFGKPGAVIDDLEMHVQNAIDNDPLFTDPALLDLAGCLADVSEDMIKTETQGQNALIEKNNHMASTRYNSFFDRWNQYADQLVFKNTPAGQAISQLWNRLERIVGSTLPPEKQPLYMIESELLSNQKRETELQALRNKAMSSKLKGLDQKLTTAPNEQKSEHFRFPTVRAFWKIHDGKAMPPGLPCGLPAHYYSGLHDITTQE